MHNIPNFATADPFDGMSEAEPCRAKNLLSGKWVGEGSNNDMAKNNALSSVAKSTAKKLVALINSKGIN